MTRRLLLAGSLALVVAVLIGFAVTGGPWNGDDGTAGSEGTATSNGSEVVGSLSAPTAGKPTKDPESGVVTHPEGSGKNGLPGLAKMKPAKVTFLVSRPLPKTAASLGKVVGGFPVEVVPVMPGSRVRSTSVSSTTKALQVSLEATSARSAEKILAYYRAALTGHGFAESKVRAVGGARAATFAHNDDNLVITVTKSHSKGSKSSTYTVFGTLHAGKSR